jgi:hypothetical protein
LFFLLLERFPSIPYSIVKERLNPDRACRKTSLSARSGESRRQAGLTPGLYPEINSLSSKKPQAHTWMANTKQFAAAAKYP